MFYEFTPSQYGLTEVGMQVTTQCRLDSVLALGSELFFALLLCSVLHKN